LERKLIGFLIATTIEYESSKPGKICFGIARIGCFRGKTPGKYSEITRRYKKILESAKVTCDKRNIAAINSLYFSLYKKYKNQKI